MAKSNHPIPSENLTPLFTDFFDTVRSNHTGPRGRPKDEIYPICAAHLMISIILRSPTRLSQTHGFDSGFLLDQVQTSHGAAFLSLVRRGRIAILPYGNSPSALPSLMSSFRDKLRTHLAPGNSTKPFVFSGWPECSDSEVARNLDAYLRNRKTLIDAPLQNRVDALINLNRATRLSPFRKEKVHAKPVPPEHTMVAHLNRFVQATRADDSKTRKLLEEVISECREDRSSYYETLKDKRNYYSAKSISRMYELVDIAYNMKIAYSLGASWSISSPQYAAVAVASRANKTRYGVGVTLADVDLFKKKFSGLEELTWTKLDEFDRDSARAPIKERMRDAAGILANVDKSTSANFGRAVHSVYPVGITFAEDITASVASFFGLELSIGDGGDAANAAKDWLQMRLEQKYGKALTGEAKYYQMLENEHLIRS